MMWVIPVIVGWAFILYCAICYLRHRRINLWVIMAFVVLFAILFAIWGFLFR